MNPETKENLARLQGVHVKAFDQLSRHFCDLPDHLAGPVAARFLGRLSYLLQIQDRITASQITKQLAAALNAEPQS